MKDLARGSAIGLRLQCGVLMEVTLAALFDTTVSIRHVLIKSAHDGVLGHVFDLVGLRVRVAGVAVHGVLAGPVVRA